MVLSAFTPPSLSSTFYDPGTCRSSWISYVQADLSAISSWKRQLDSISSQVSQPPTKIITITHTSIQTIVVPQTSECDGTPRVSSVSEATRIWVDTKSRTDLLDSPNGPVDMWFGPDYPEYPSCTIKPEDCQKQWNLFKHFFANWTAPSDTLVDVGYNDPDMCSMHPLFCPSQLKFNMDSWVGFRYAELQRGFFDQCPEPVMACEANQGNLGIPRSMEFTANEPPVVTPRCAMNIGRFVLIFFPPPVSNVSRDLCANNGFGDISAPPATNVTEGLLVTATMKHITFHSRSGELLLIQMLITKPDTHLQNLMNSISLPVQS
jgi:hypothetical protein